jgi:hypothetical protein
MVVAPNECHLIACHARRARGDFAETISDDLANCLCCNSGCTCLCVVQIESASETTISDARVTSCDVCIVC